MPLDANEIEDQGSSTDPALDGREAIASADATSSAATDETDDGLLSVVRDVVADSRKTDDQSASSAESTEGEGSEPPEGQSSDDDDFSNVPFNQHPRFKGLVTERNNLRQQVQSFRQDAERYQNVQTFIDNHGLSAEEAADGLVIMGLMKTNPAQAWQRMKPTIQRLLVAAGEVLPQDLQQRVQAGEMSAEAALEVSRSRAGVASQQAYSQFEAQRRQQTAHQSAVAATQQAAYDWQAERQRKDPNFGVKLEPLSKEVAFLQRREGIPRTPEGVRDQLNRAYKSLVVPAASAPQAQKKPITPIRGGQVAGKAAPQATSMLDIVRANRRTA